MVLSLHPLWHLKHIYRMATRYLSSAHMGEADAIWGIEVFVDWGTTILLLRAGLGIREANPIHAFLFRRVGYAGDFLLLCAFLALVFVFIWPGVPRSGQLGVCCAYTLVYVNNGLVFRRKLRAKRRAEQRANLAAGGGNELGKRGSRWS